MATFWDAVVGLRDLLKFEFFFEPRDEFRATVTAELALHDPEWELHVAAGSAEVQNLLEDIRPLTAHTVLRSFLESYLVAATAIAQQSGRDVEEKELLRRCKTLGRQYQLQQRIHSPESLARPLFTNAIQLAESRNLVSGPASDDERQRVRRGDPPGEPGPRPGRAARDDPRAGADQRRAVDLTVAARAATSRHAPTRIGADASVAQAR